MIFGVFVFITLILTVNAYTGLEERDGFSECYVIDYMTGSDARLYNCSGVVTMYQDYSDRNTDSDGYYYPESDIFYNNKMGFATYDMLGDSANFSDGGLTKHTDVEASGIQTSGGVCLNLIISFIQWAASHISKATKTVVSACLVEGHLVRHNGRGMILRMDVQNNRFSGADCDSEAQWETITGALKKWIGSHNHMCGTWCMGMTHGGDWTGYVSLGVEIAVDSCDLVFKWGGLCTPVGKKDDTGK